MKAVEKKIERNLIMFFIPLLLLYIVVQKLFNFKLITGLSNIRNSLVQF